MQISSVTGAQSKLSQLQKLLPSDALYSQFSWSNKTMVMGMIFVGCLYLFFAVLDYEKNGMNKFSLRDSSDMSLPGGLCGLRNSGPESLQPRKSVWFEGDPLAGVSASSSKFSWMGSANDSPGGDSADRR
mmetsp:Transcript_14741/g.33228  ORF Transcript_14741/g.33228 Transcript_14741/m.33228 type:complete len:130 (+) Transcript_14741:2-391(+)